MATRELSILIKARNLAAGAFKSVEGNIKHLSGVSKTLGKGFSNIGQNLEKGVALGVGAAAAGIGYAVKSAGDFQAALNTINTVAQTSDKNLQAIGESMRALARATGTPLSELTTGYYDLVSAGIKAADAQNVLVQANTLAIGGLGTTGEAIDLLTTAINSYGGDASKAAAFTNYFAEAIAKGKTTTADLAGSFAEVGPIAAQAGIGLDEIAAAYGVMTATGTPAAQAATQMRAALIALQSPSAKMVGLQKKLNVNFLQMAKDKGLAFAYNELTKAADDAGIQMIDLTGRVDGANFAAQVAGTNYKKYTDELEVVRHSSDGAGVAQAQMAQRQKGLNFQIARLKTNTHDAAIEIGTALLPAITALASKGVEWLTTHRDDVKDFATNLAAGFQQAVTWASKLDWNAIGNTLKTVAGVGKSLLEAFLAMPPWVQTAIATGWGLNKLSGGMVSGLIGQLGSGLIKGVLGMTAGVVNIKAGVVTGGGGGGIPTPGGKGPGGFGGGLINGLKTGAALASIPLVAEAAVQVQNFEDMRTKVTSGLEAKLDSMKRGTLAETQASAAKITAELNRQRPLFDQIIFNGHIRPILERELAQLSGVALGQRQQLAVTAQHKAVADLQTGRLYAIEGVGREQIPYLQAIRDKELRISFLNQIHLSVNEWQRTATSAQIAASPYQAGTKL